ncbi:MAG: M4 family metallopeptidase [candidate division Zixibacteria bacterium]|nr:M4 family metallopeptidase [candidate division Zixibacteria bacterium]
MRRVWVVVLVGVSSFVLNQPIHAMHKINTPPGVLGAQLAKRPPGPSLTAEQQATIKRRIVTAMSGLDKIHVVGTKTAPIPPEALDALAEWRGQNAKDVEIWWDPDTRTPFFIKGNDLTLPTSAPLGKLGHDLRTSVAAGTFSQLPEFLGLRNAATELRPVSQQTDQLGLTHVRFQQTYRGHDVWARDLYCHFTSDSRMNLINGRWAPTPIQLDGINPAIDASAAVVAVKSHFADRSPIETSNTTLVVYIDSDQTPHWAWMVRTSLGSTEGYDVFIDAVTGGCLHQVSFVYSDGPVVGSGVDLFGLTRTVNAYQVGSWYYMINTTKSMFNAGASSFPDNPKGAITILDRNYTSTGLFYVRTPNQLSWGNPSAVSASWNLGIVYDYFLQIHGRNGIDGAGSTILAVVNDSLPKYAGNNAFFANGTQCMFFGIGNGICTSNLAAALDVTGHEMAHGVIGATAGLVYEDQSGAMNESYADIFGAMVEFYAKGSSGNWLIGEDVITPSVPGDALRDMADPASSKVGICCICSKQPVTMSDPLYYHGTGDHGGVHQNSGVTNRAFYLVASAIGRGKADTIYYRALTTGKLASSAHFIDLRRGVLQSASELYPGNTAITNAIVSAYDAVEIFDGPPTPPPGTEPIPTSAQWIAAIDNVTGRVARFDTAGNFQYLISSGIATRKPSISDSAQVVFFIDATQAVRAVGATGIGEAQISTPGIIFNNISVSPDGRQLAYDLSLDPTIYIYDLIDTTRASDRIWALYTPTYTDSVVAHDVFEADVLEWDITGRKIFYDCWNRLPRQYDTIWYWDILTLDAKAGVIQRAIPAIPTGVTIGNPTVAKTRSNIIAFDAALIPGSMTVVGADLERNRLDVLTLTGTSWGRPSFAPDDRRLVYHYAGDIWRVSLDSTSIHGMANDHKLMSFADAPNWRFTGRDTPVDVSDGDGGSGIPLAFSLHQNYPNPFNASTVISYDARSIGPAALEVFNILGQRVFVRNEESVLPGRHTFTWDGVDQSGASVPSGLYLYRVTVGGAQQTRKMVLLK